MMGAAILIASVAGFALSGARFGFGVIAGGVLAYANYYWLDRSTKALFAGITGAKPQWLAIKYILRYVFLGAVLLLIFVTDAFPIAAVILGLAAFAFAVVIQGFRSIFFST